MNVILFTVPLVSILFSTIYIYNSSEFIELLLSQPLDAPLGQALKVPLPGSGTPEPQAAHPTALPAALSQHPLLREREVRGHTHVRKQLEILEHHAGLATQLLDRLGGDPVAGASVLTLVIDNVALTDNAAAKGFGTGLTLGAVGSMVTDGYVCTATYERNGERFEVSAKHALHTTIGNKAGPEGLTPVTMQQGVEQVMDQLAWNVLKQLADKQAFE